MAEEQAPERCEVPKDRCRVQPRLGGSKRRLLGEISRRNHPDYAERNRQLQRQRNAKTRKIEGGHLPPDEPEFLLPSGRYQLIRIDSEGVANGNVWIVEITAIACSLWVIHAFSLVIANETVIDRNTFALITSARNAPDTPASMAQIQIWHGLPGDMTRRHAAAGSRTSTS
jgi:hypothetical protein